jgi:hypothetical protein
LDHHRSEDRRNRPGTLHDPKQFEFLDTTDIDGQRFAEHHIISAVGVDTEGKKHILGIEPGVTENSAAVKRLLTHLRDHGLRRTASTCGL